MTPDLQSYDYYVVAFSGGKDSLACLLTLLEAGVPMSKIELMHHDVDGREGSNLMDWPCTRDYCRKVAEAFGLPIYFSWKVGGFEREMLRDGTPTAPTKFETPVAPFVYGNPTTTVESGGRGPAGTRLKFPQVSADLSVRWCSAYVKIDVGSTALRNQARFDRARTLFITGERAEESAARAKYKVFEPHRADRRTGRDKRHVDQWRPVHAMTEREVWKLLERFSINPHPAYRLGWGRVSCMKCIFGSANQWASAYEIDPVGVRRIAEYERQFGVTIKRKLTVMNSVDAGKAYDMDPVDVKAAMSETFDEPIILGEGTWELPKGAFGESCGPT